MSDYPIGLIKADLLPMAWERALLWLLAEGSKIETEFDRPEDPPSLDAFLVVRVNEPMKEPRIHRAIPTGFKELWDYVLDVCEGAHNDRIGNEGWSYTYNNRLTSYPGQEGSIDQVAKMLERLAKTPFTRRAQAITWIPETDAVGDEPPCLQRIWARMSQNREGFRLHLVSDFRSNDWFKAAFMNMFALTELQRRMAEKLQVMMGQPVEPGTFTQVVAGSAHIYGAYLKQVEGFRKQVSLRSFADRTYRTDDPIVQEGFREAEQEVEVGRRPIPRNLIQDGEW
jgi:thymidylate synthase